MNGPPPDGMALRRCTACKRRYDPIAFAVLIDHKSIKFIAASHCVYCREAARQRKRRRAL